MAVFPRPEEILIYEGSYFTAEWYYTREGKLPAHEYYAGLSDVDQRRLDALVRYFCDSKPGTILPPTIYRIENQANKIYALKPRTERFFNFTTDGAKMILTNAYRKHSQKMTRQDLEKLKMAIRYREDYFVRVREGMYYGK